MAVRLAQHWYARLWYKEDFMGSIKVNACVTCGGNCMGCFHADECPRWLDTGDRAAQAEYPAVRLALCESRHSMPVDVEGAIFPQTVDPTDIRSIKLQCVRSLRRYYEGGKKPVMVVYVTGLTVALVEVINYCRSHKIRLILMHYDRESGEYFPQEVV